MLLVKSAKEKSMTKKSKLILSATAIIIVIFAVFFGKAIKSENNIRKELDRMKAAETIEFNGACYEEILPEDLKKYSLKEDVKSDVNLKLTSIQSEIPFGEYNIYSSKSVPNSSVIIWKNGENYSYCVFCNYTKSVRMTRLLNTYGIKDSDDIQKIKTGKFTHKSGKYKIKFYNEISNCKIDKSIEDAEHLYDVELYNKQGIPMHLSKCKKDGKEFFYANFNYYLIN